ncbi:MAG: aspartate 1-decarboxylase [Gammaproteobacteria bacterium]
MQIIVLKSKIHRARVSEVHLDYEGSCAIDRLLLEAANIREFEQVHIYNVTNGERLVTYAILASPGNGTISLNGAAAHKAHVGDIVIIAAYAVTSESEARDFHPQRVYVDEQNQIVRTGPRISSIVSDR